MFNKTPSLQGQARVLYRNTGIPAYLEKLTISVARDGSGLNRSHDPAVPAVGESQLLSYIQVARATGAHQRTVNLSDGGTTEPRRLRSIPFLLSLYLLISGETLRDWQSHKTEGDNVPEFLQGGTFTLNRGRTQNKLLILIH